MSKAMTKAQITHLTERIDAAITQAKNTFTESLPPCGGLSPSQKAAEVAAGRFKVVTNKDGTLPNYTSEAIQFPAEVKIRAQKSKNDAAVAKFLAPLKNKKAAILDNAVLGDASEALAALNAFVGSLAVKQK